MRETDGWTLGVIVGLAVITVIARGFFFISEKPWRLPGWALRGLQFAPVAALTAVIAPDILLAGQAFTAPWRDARLLAALAAAAFYFWRRGTGYALPASIGIGMAVYLPLHVMLGW
ncbi:MAG: AzlD domain-containing protein [Ottowia sp.]